MADHECKQESMIQEIRADVKDLVAFKNKLLGIQITVSILSTSFISFVAWILSMVMK